MNKQIAPDSIKNPLESKQVIGIFFVLLDGGNGS